MKKNKLLWITTLVCLLPILLSLVLYDQLPAEVAIHFKADGVADGYAPKALAAFGLPVLMAVINIVTHFGLNNDPKKMNAALALNYMGKWMVPIISVILMPITLFIALGYKIPVQIIAPTMVGVILVACGNYLPKCKQNYTIGIKLPWTLNSEENWNKTHRMAGKLWVLGGMCMIIGSFIPVQGVLFTLIIIVVITIVPFGYSYGLYKKEI